jgi:hypothetical protein
MRDILINELNRLEPYRWTDTYYELGYDEGRGITHMGIDFRRASDIADDEELVDDEEFDANSITFVFNENGTWGWHRGIDYDPNKIQWLEDDGNDTIIMTLSEIVIDIFNTMEY